MAQPEPRPQEEWANIAKSRCDMLIDFYPKRLNAVFKSKGALI